MDAQDRLNLVLRVAMVAIFAVAIGLSIAVGLAFANDRATYDTIPDNTYIAGVDVSGMTATEAREAVSAKVSEASSNITVDFTYAPIGYEKNVTLYNQLACNVDEAVADAVEMNHQTSALSRIVDGVSSSTPDRRDIPLSYSLTTDDVLTELRTIAYEIDCQPSDAWREFNDDDTVTLHEAVDGRTLNVDASATALRTAIRDASTSGLTLDEISQDPLPVDLVVDLTPADLHASDLPVALIVNYTDFKLYVFEGDEVIWWCYIGYGQGLVGDTDYSSPTGLHYIEAKDPAPYWYNPDPEGWGANMPDVVEPGEDNPLGLRSLKISDAPLIYIHGVSNIYRIGQQTSHGCINVYNDDVLVLYDLIPDPATVPVPVYVYFHY